MNRPYYSAFMSATRPTRFTPPWKCLRLRCASVYTRFVTETDDLSSMRNRLFESYEYHHSGAGSADLTFAAVRPQDGSRRIPAAVSATDR
jgi:hypothetical protein